MADFLSGLNCVFCASLLSSVVFSPPSTSIMNTVMINQRRTPLAIVFRARFTGLSTIVQILCRVVLINQYSLRYNFRRQETIA